MGIELCSPRQGGAAGCGTGAVADGDDVENARSNKHEIAVI